MSQVLDNKVNPNDYNFTEKKLLSNDGPVEMLVTNNTTRTMKFGETVFLNGYIGEVMEQDGILASADGLININPDRHISMNQVDVADTFAAQKNPIYFLPQTNSDPGEWKDTDAVGLVSFKAEVIESAPAATPPYIVFKPPYQNGDLVATT
jgi:hypothetical protein